MRLVLASASPRRRELLANAGLAFDVEPVDLDEGRAPGEAPHAYVERLAREKAEAVARRRPGAIVLGADTAVVLGDDVLGKPVDAADASRMLQLLSGRSHEVMTGVAVVSNGRTASRVARTVVWFADLTGEQIAAYVATGEPADKAGAYAIQGGAAAFVTRTEGSYSNVVGLPMDVVADLLAPFVAPT
jgi:septum formation protein